MNYSHFKIESVETSLCRMKDSNSYSVFHSEIYEYEDWKSPFPESRAFDRFWENLECAVIRMCMNNK